MIKPIHHSIYYLVVSVPVGLLGFTTTAYLFLGGAIFFIGVQMIVDAIKEVSK